jgi:hypothetical protein
MRLVYHMSVFILFLTLVECKMVFLLLIWIVLEETCKINIFFYMPLWRGCTQHLYCIMPWIWFGRFQNTNTKSHITVLTLYLYSPLYSCAEQTQKYRLEDQTGQWLLKSTASLVACQCGQCKLPALSIRSAWGQDWTACESFWHHMKSRGGSCS